MIIKKHKTQRENNERKLVSKRKKNKACCNRPKECTQTTPRKFSFLNQASFVDWMSFK